MEKINLFIVEDEPIIAADLADRLEEIGYTILGIFDKGEAAFAALDTLIPDIILMDVQLAGKWDGIETTRQIANKGNFSIIYLTSNSDDATFNKAKLTKPAAFLSKPFRGRDLIHAIELTILQNTQKEKVESVSIADGQTVWTEDRLFIKEKVRLVRVFFKDILWIEADGYYCRLVTQRGSTLITQTLAKFSEKFDKQTNFFRVHRSFLVNLAHIEQINDAFLLIGTKQIPISQASRAELLQRIK